MKILMRIFHIKHVRIGMLILLGFLLTVGYQKVFFDSSSGEVTEVRANDSSYRFINPLLYYKSAPDKDFDSLKKEIGRFIEAQKKLGNAQDVSVYYRDMNSGQWTGIDENNPYEPASMLKVTMLIAYLNRADSKPSLLKERVYYESTGNMEESYRSTHRPTNGYYSVDELLQFMVEYSDNDALSALEKKDAGGTAEVFSLFQLPTPNATSTSADYMSARQYSRIFRVLYDSTFLSRESSERALSILSHTDFNNGLVAGVPAGVAIAHKFGERTDMQSNTLADKELHDCGIVYTANPYFLCVMTRGSDFAKLEPILQEVSRIAYGYNRK